MLKLPIQTKYAQLSLLALSLASLFTMQGCKAKKPVVAAAAEQTNPNEVSVTPALAKNLRFGTPITKAVAGTLQVAARVETDARLIARVGSPVSGRILRLVAFEGQYIKAGAALATLHSTDLSDTQFALIKSASQQALAEAAEKRAEQLVAADVIGKAELERRRAEVLQASTEAASYRTQLNGLGMTTAQIRQLEATRKLNADYPIVAPKSGTILKREITIGQVVQPADPAFTIADLSSVWVTANVPEEEAGSLKKGMAVTVHIPALPDREIIGHLNYVAPIVDPSTRTVAVRMDVANPNGLLKPDQLASMTFVGHADPKLTVPDTAVVREENKDYVFVQVAPQKYILREVSLGESVEGSRPVLSGVREDEHIVTDGAFHLNNQRKQNAVKGSE